MFEMTEFYKLPDTLDEDVLKKQFYEFITCYYNDTSVSNVNYALSELLELSERQWNTYELLDKEIKKVIEQYLKSIINFEDKEIIDYMLSIIPMLGLKELFDYIIQNKKTICDETIVKIIEEVEAEYGADVDNPYSGMQKV